MRLLKKLYEKRYGKPAPYYYDYSILTIIKKPIRKWICQCVAPNCVSNRMRIFWYRRCGFQIGKNVFIGMKCYLDDMCYDMLKIEDDVIISYGVYFACHGRNQSHLPIVVGKGAYIGMRSNIISKGGESGRMIGPGAVIGACTLVNQDIPAGATAVGVPCRIIKGAVQ